MAGQPIELSVVEEPEAGAYEGVVLAVAHRQFRSEGVERFRSFARANHVFYDLKHVFADGISDLRL